MSRVTESDERVLVEAAQNDPGRFAELYDQRTVILLRFAEEKSIREIATQLNRSEGAVNQLQFRGLENLRARLRE